MMLTFVNVIWGARCGKTARRVLLGETRTRGHAYSVRRRRESACDRKAPHRLKSSRLVSTNLFDLWADVWRRKAAKGDVIIVRYADDLVLGFQLRADAMRFLEEFKERLAKFGLELHPEKTPADRVRALCCQRSAAAWRGKTRDVHLLGLHPLLWAAPQDRYLHRLAYYGEEADGCEAQGHQGRASPPDACSPERGRCMASEGRQRLLPIPRGARKYPTAEHLQAAHQPAVVSGTRTPQSACPQKVGGSHSVVRTVDTAPESPAPLSSSSLLRHSSFIRAVCVNALVRICAGGDQRWSSLLRQLEITTASRELSSSCYECWTRLPQISS